MLEEKERNHEENRPVRDSQPPPRNSRTAKSTSQLLAVMAIPGISTPNSRPPTRLRYGAPFPRSGDKIT